MLSVGSQENHPGARSRASAWKGIDNTLWLFGGQGLDSECNSGE